MKKKSKPSFATEKSLWAQGFELIVGVDEVGRGALAGPVVAGAVIFSVDTNIKGVNDSKQLKVEDRERLAKEIQSQSLFCAIGKASNIEIDEHGILVATKLAMERALEKLKSKPDFLLVDAMKLVWGGVSCQPIVKGDQKSISIAAASILAKVHRDKLMSDFAKEYPEYGFEVNMGYGTKDHFAGVEKNGLCDIHRKCFKCFVEDNENMKLF